MTVKVRAVGPRAVKKKKIQKILSIKNYYFLHIFILKPNEEQETEQLDLDMVEYYADKYNKFKNTNRL